jgi:hypothetical protein
MEITSRSFWTLLHGMGFGALYLLACSGALVEFYRRFIARNHSAPQPESPFLKSWLILMSFFAWLAVLTGTYLVYPWYRASPPPGTIDLTAYPQRLLVPITITMAAGVVARYGSDLRHHPRLRSAVLAMVLVSFLSAGLAGFWGAMINKFAPVTGGTSITLMKGDIR